MLGRGAGRRLGTRWDAVAMSGRRGGPPSKSSALLLLALVAVLVAAGMFIAISGDPEWTWGLFGSALGCLVVAVAALGSQR